MSDTQSSSSLSGRDGGQRPPDGHPSSELALLVSGELTVEQMRPLVAHLRGCPACQRELVEVAAATGALRMAARPELAQVTDLPAPAFMEEVRRSAPAAETAGARSVEPTPVGIHAGPGPAGQGMDGASGAVVPMRRRRPWLAAAAAAAVLAVGGIAAGLLATAGGHPPASQTVALAPVGPGQASGDVHMRGRGQDRTMTVSTVLPAAQPGTYYEVWLLKVSTGAMVPVGVLPASGSARYVLPAAVVSGYNAVDISLQPDNGSTQHSNDSVLRARYA